MALTSKGGSSENGKNLPTTAQKTTEETRAENAALIVEDGSQKTNFYIGILVGGVRKTSAQVKSMLTENFSLKQEKLKEVLDNQTRTAAVKRPLTSNVVTSIGENDESKST